MDALTLFDNAITAQRKRMTGYEIQSEALTLETIRALDYVYFKDLIPELSQNSHLSDQEISIMQWGVNEALSRIFPKHLSKTAHFYTSNETIQSKADNFIFDAGVLAMALRQRTLVSQKLLKGFIDPRVTKSGNKLLVLEAVDSSVYWDAIGRTGMSWLSNKASTRDQARELELEQHHLAILPELDKYLSEPNSWKLKEPFNGYKKHFHSWAEIYLRRMVYQDLLGIDDVIGDHSYGKYISVLTVISAICQMRICYAGILHSKRQALNIRNLLTGVSSLQNLRIEVANFLDAESKEAAELLDHLILAPQNCEHHFLRSTPAWAPIVQTSEHACILPSFGLDINPFLFLLNELKTRYEADWFKLANRREGRWIAELMTLFPSPRWICKSGVKLKRNGNLVTDIDFLALDIHTGQLALFQLKWQQPSLNDEKVRHSNGSNFVDGCNEWIHEVRGWLEEFGINEFLIRARIDHVSVEKFSLFVLARYSAHFPTKTTPDQGATWSDWGHLRKHREVMPNGSVVDLQYDLDNEIRAQQQNLNYESFVLPLPGLAVIVNPTKNPWAKKQ